MYCNLHKLQRKLIATSFIYATLMYHLCSVINFELPLKSCTHSCWECCALLINECKVRIIPLSNSFESRRHPKEANAKDQIT